MSKKSEDIVRRIGIVRVTAAAWLSVLVMNGQAADPPAHRWNGYLFGAAGGSLGDNNATFQGGGGGVEGYVWKGLAASADLSLYRDNYYRFSGTGYFGAQVAWHFASQEKTRGADPYVLLGGGAWFREGGGAVHGGAGLNYWFAKHVGARFEFRVGSRPYGDNVDGVVRFGVALR